MAFTINTNTLSLVAQNNLSNSQKSLNSAIERLSSGSQINSAKDDAAGQAIANRMTSQIKGLQQASSNANDGISLAQTTEGALDQVNDNLQRVRELTVQAANGTNSSSDLESIQNEINQRLGEIDRVSDQTSFNGTKVLDGSKTTIDIQVGDKDGQTISINLAKMDSSTLGLDSFDVTNLAKTETAGSYNDATNTAAADASFSLEDDSGNVVKGTVQTGTDGNVYVTDSDGNSYAATAVEVQDDAGAAAADGSTVAVTFDSANVVDAATASAAGLSPLKDLDSALKQVDDLRSDLGAVQNRMDSAISNISTTTINISSARSRIEDTDYATEVSNLSKAQILQQAGTSVLAQANQTGQGVLSLLG